MPNAIKELLNAIWQPGIICYVVDKKLMEKHRIQAQNIFKNNSMDNLKENQ